MPIERLTCPSCEAVLKPPSGAAPGSKIKCPKCSNLFAIPEEEEPARAEAAPVAARRRARPIDDDPEYEEDYEERRPRRRKKKQGMSPAVLAVIIVIGVSIPLLAAAGAAWYLLGKTESKVTIGPGQFRPPFQPGEGLPGGPPPGGNPNPPRNNPPPPAAGPAEGATAPEIEGEDLDGAKFKLSDYRGKVVLLDFWGHW